jgi:hypothetical protein
LAWDARAITTGREFGCREHIHAKPPVARKTPRIFPGQGSDGIEQAPGEENPGEKNY